MARKKTEEPAFCRDHTQTPALARCQSCGRPLCGECYRFQMDGKPGCARCAYEASTRPQRRLSLAVVFLSLSVGVGFWGVRRHELWEREPAVVFIGALVALGVSLFIALSGRDAKSVTVTAREPDEELDPDLEPPAGAHPYRATARRMLLAVSPRVSGKATALIMVASMLAAAVLVPASVRLPRWVEGEIVLGAWWLIVAGTLTTLLYRSFRLSDDYVYFPPWDRPSAPGGSSSGSGGSSSSGLSGLDGCGADAEGCLVGIVVVLVLGVALAAAWVLVEIAMPLLFFVMYALLMRAVRTAARDQRGCAGQLARSLGWASLWATVYVAPIALVTWAMHAFGR